MFTRIFTLPTHYTLHKHVSVCVLQHQSFTLREAIVRVHRGTSSPKCIFLDNTNAHTQAITHTLTHMEERKSPRERVTGTLVPFYVPSTLQCSDGLLFLAGSCHPPQARTPCHCSKEQGEKETCFCKSDDKQPCCMNIRLGIRTTMYLDVILWVDDHSVF